MRGISQGAFDGSLETPHLEAEVLERQHRTPYLDTTTVMVVALSCAWNC